MDQEKIAKVVQLLADAYRSGIRIKALPPDVQISTKEEAHAIQDALVQQLGQPVAGWKVSGLDGASVRRGALLAPRLLASPAQIAAAQMPLLGIEGEVAFRFDRDFAARSEPYERDELARGVTALAAIEIVDTRFADYESTPPLHRLSDCMSNGGLVCGSTVRDWAELDFSTIPVTLRRNGEAVVKKRGGHANIDPLLPALALTNAFRSASGVQAGQVMTTGSLTGLTYATLGDKLELEIGGLGSVEVEFI